MGAAVREMEINGNVLIVAVPRRDTKLINLYEKIYHRKPVEKGSTKKEIGMSLRPGFVLK